MKVRDRIFEKYESYEFEIPLNDSIKLYVKEGDSVSLGDKIFSKAESSVKDSIYLPKALSCNIEEIRDYLEILPGEFVDKGDLLAERILPNGLTVKRIESNVSGIVSDKRLGDGYIDIMGEQREVEVEGNFSGEVLSADPVRGLRIKAKTTALDLRAISKDFFDSKNKKLSISGEFVLIGDGTSVYTVNDLEENYSGKIVFVGRYVYEDVVKKLFELGASCVISYSMDYSTFRKINLPIGVIGGFGNMSFPEDIRKQLSKLSGSFVVADGSEKQIFFVEKEGFVDVSSKKKDTFVDIYVGEKIISYEPQSYGRVGEVIGYDSESEYLTVEFKKGVNGIVSLGAVDFLGL